MGTFVLSSKGRILLVIFIIIQKKKKRTLVTKVIELLSHNITFLIDLYYNCFIYSIFKDSS